MVYPLLAKERARKREARAAETALEAVTAATKRSENRGRKEQRRQTNAWYCAGRSSIQRRADRTRIEGKLPGDSLRSLLDDLSTIARNRAAGVQEMTTIRTPLQEKALKLLNVRLRPE